MSPHSSTRSAYFAGQEEGIESVQQTITPDLTGLAGQTVTLKFAGTDFAWRGPTTFAIDDTAPRAL